MVAPLRVRTFVCKTVTRGFNDPTYLKHEGQHIWVDVGQVQPHGGCLPAAIAACTLALDQLCEPRALRTQQQPAHKHTRAQQVAVSILLL